MPKTSYYTTIPTGCVEPKIGSCPYSSVEPITIVDKFQSTVERFGSRNAMALKRPEGDDPKTWTMPTDWTYWTWAEYYEDCRKFAKTLMKLGCKEYTVVNVIGFNSPEWFIANNGAILASQIAAGIYTTNLADACKYISEHSKAEVVVMEGNKQLAKYAEIAKDLPHLKALVVWGEDVDPSLAKKCGCAVYAWDTFLTHGEGVTDAKLAKRQEKIRPGNCSTLIYTSGTTGPPKAVMVSHDNVTWTSATMSDNYMPLNHEDRIVSYLPLSHIAAQLVDIHIPMHLGCCTYFCDSAAMKGTLTVTMKDVRPTFFFGVPRVWEKIQEKMAAIGRNGSAVKQLIGNWAKGLGKTKNQAAQFGKGGGTPCGYSCANAIIFQTIKKQLGLDQAKACFTAAAPISPDTVWYFASLDIPVYEVFGQSECSGPQTVSAPGVWKVGSCGRPFKGTESKITATGELCYRGRHIFMGYMYMEDKTKETIDADGFLHSGDIADFDNDVDRDIVAGPAGFMRITGRIKEILITAGGENIAPVLIENEMKTAMLAVSNCMVVGDKQKFLAMLVSLKTETGADGAPTDLLAADALEEGKRIGSAAKTVTEALVDDKWSKYFEAGMKKANLNAPSNAQKVQKFSLMPNDFSEKEGTLTPTLKLKRNVATSMYEDDIKSVYGKDWKE